MAESIDVLWQRLAAEGATEPLIAAIEQYATHHPGALATAVLLAELGRRQGRHHQAIALLDAVEPSLLEREHSQRPQLVGLLRHTWGLLQREQGQFAAAARAFIEAFALDPALLASVHALQFTRLTPEEVAALCEPFRAAVERCSPAPPLALQLLADWQQLQGERPGSCALSYRAAQLSVSPQQRHRLDRLSPPDLPEALIIGAPKCGTTSLAGWLAGHPQVFVHPRKELHFFDNRWHWGADWYRCQFPRFRRDGFRIVRLEATPNYLQLAPVPGRVRQLMPQARLIVMLRHPVQRALSWCQHITRQEGVARPAAQIIGEELQLLERGEAGPWAGEGDWHATNCLFGSLYSSQLERWRRRFAERQLLVLQLEHTMAQPQQAWRRIAAFLEIDPHGSGTGPAAEPFPRLNAAPGAYQALPAPLQQRLERVLHAEIKLWSGLPAAQEH